MHAGAQGATCSHAGQPLRYLAFVVSRSRTHRSRRRRSDGVDALQRVALGARPIRGRRAARPRGRASAPPTSRSSTSRSSATAPYPSFTLALVESELPGGHSPGYFAVLNQPLPVRPFVVAQRSGVVRETIPILSRPRDRAPVVGTGGRLAQLPRAVAQRRLRAVFRGPLRADSPAATTCSAACCARCGVGASTASDQGPIYLGYRLGHIRDDSRVFRAVVYNKGAVVLHMLRRLVGDDAFFAAFGASIASRGSRKVGTDGFPGGDGGGNRRVRSNGSSSGGSTARRCRACSSATASKRRRVAGRASLRADRRDLRSAVDGHAAVRRSDSRSTSSCRSPIASSNLRVPLSGTLREQSRSARDDRHGWPRSPSFAKSPEP